MWKLPKRCQIWPSKLKEFYQTFLQADCKCAYPWTLNIHTLHQRCNSFPCLLHTWVIGFPVIDMQAQKELISCNLACVAASILLMLRNRAPSTPFIAPMTCTSQILVYGCLEMAGDSKYFRWKKIEESKNCFQSLLAYQVVSPFQKLAERLTLGVLPLNVSDLSWFKWFLHECIVFSLCKHLCLWTDSSP